MPSESSLVFALFMTIDNSQVLLTETFLFNLMYPYFSQATFFTNPSSRSRNNISPLSTHTFYFSSVNTFFSMKKRPQNVGSLNSLGFDALTSHDSLQRPISHHSTGSIICSNRDQTVYISVYQYVSLPMINLFRSSMCMYIVGYIAWRITFPNI